MDSTRQVFIGELEGRFKPFTDELHAELQQMRFYFEEQRIVHLAQLDTRLIIRHSIPYCITEETYFGLNKRGVQFFAAVLLLHSFALTRIDDYYDGGNLTKSTEQLNVDALAYSLSATHTALISLVQRSPNARELVKLLNVTNFVHSRMYKDHTERYRLEYLDSPERRIQTYLHSSRSRLLGSGYWEVMARASFVQRGKSFPAYLHSIDIKLRKFRQIIDELCDIEEDLRAGLVTLPVLHALSAHSRPALVCQTVLRYWEQDSLAKAAVPIRVLLKESNTRQWIYKQAMPLYSSAMKELDTKLGARGDGYRKLFDYKRAKLEALVAA